MMGLAFMPIRIQLSVWFVKANMPHKTKLILFLRFGILSLWQTIHSTPILLDG